MKELQEIISKYGKILPGDILKIDSFLNHQIDVNILDTIGKEFARLFNETNPEKILTIESSGIAIAQATSLNMNRQPVVYAKKGSHLNMSSDVYQCEEKSYTKDVVYVTQVAKEFLKENERILIIDDFLANGEALNSLLNICSQAKVNIVGVGIVVCKMYQPGYERVKKIYNNIEILAKIKSMSIDGIIEWE